MKKQLLFINGHLNLGGCERSLVDLLNHIDYEKYDVDLLLLEEKGDYLSELNSNVKVYLYSLNNAFGSIKSVITNSIKNKDWFSIKFRLIYLLSTKLGKKALFLSKRLFKDLNKKYDIITAYRPGICTDLAAFTFDSDIKISWWHHGEFNLSKSSLIDSYREMNYIAVVSNNCIDMLCKELPQFEDRYRLVSNMVCVDDIVNKSCQYNVDYDRAMINIVSVGRLSTEKNMIYCPQIAKELKNQNIDFHWYVIGDGVERDSIENAIIENDVNDKVTMLGALSNPYPYVKNADLFVHPSGVESQGIAILEAMALGTPVIVADSLGPREFIDNKNGVIVDCSVNSFVKEIMELLTNNDKFACLRNNTVLPQKYLPKSVMNQFFNIMEN